jgi:caspase domain-containing protein
MKASWLSAPLLLAVLLPVLLLGGGAASARTISYAVAIGNNQPPPGGDAAGLAVLRYADDDAVRYHQLFSRFADQARLLTVMDAQTQRRYPGLASAARAPTLANLLGIVDEYARSMAADRARGDEPVFYLAFSGHGARGDAGEAFLALMDARLTQDVLYQQVLAPLPASYQHVIVDACHAAAVVGIRGGGFEHELEATSTPVSPSELVALAERTQNQHPTVGVLVATSVGQEAHEWSRIESGVFTHEVISGLLGAADVNGDSRIEYSELQAFVSAANRGVKDPRAMLQVVARPPKINQGVALVALDRFRDAVLLSGRAGDLGHFYIELDNGQRYLDANLDAGSAAALALPARTLAFVRTESLEAEVPTRPGGTIRLRELVFKPRQLTARGSIEAAYRAALFSLPYGPAYYRGFVDSLALPGVAFPEPGGGGLEARAADGSASRRRVAIGLVSLACVSAAVSVVTGIAALRAKSDFDATTIQREAADANDRYRTYTALSLTGAAVAAAAGIGAWAIWPRRAPTLVAAPLTGDRGKGFALGLGGVW